MVSKMRSCWGGSQDLTDTADTPRVAAAEGRKRETRRNVWRQRATSCGVRFDPHALATAAVSSMHTLSVAFASGMATMGPTGQRAAAQTVL